MSMWHMASGSCLPSAAEDGLGNQIDGIDVPFPTCFGSSGLSNGCADSRYKGANTPYTDVQGEPFRNIPTYYKVTIYTKKLCILQSDTWSQVKYCNADDSWRISYHVYFKKDVGHKSDFEWAIIKFVKDPNANDAWTRHGIFMEGHGDYTLAQWESISNTFDSLDDIFSDGKQGANYPKLYFGKWSHSVHFDTESDGKDTCLGPEFRANDFQFWSLYNLRHESVIDESWNYGQATNPRSVDVCDDRGAEL